MAELKKYQLDEMEKHPDDYDKQTIEQTRQEYEKLFEQIDGSDIN